MFAQATSEQNRIQKDIIHTTRQTTKPLRFRSTRRQSSHPSATYFLPHDGEPCACCSATMRAAQKRLEASDQNGEASGIYSKASSPASKDPKGITHSSFTTDRHPERPLLITNVRIFDGITLELKEGLRILVEGNRIVSLMGQGEEISNVDVLDAGGRLAMPGLIDAHWHTTLCAVTQMAALTADIGYIHLLAAKEAELTLLRGFTTVRDTGGPAFSLKRAIDEKILKGPRIYPSGAMISQTSGHGDFRMRYEIPRGNLTPLSHPEALGVSMVADGETEVLRRVREQLMLGASQIKLMAGGGVTSVHDPLDSTQFRESEIRAAVEAAEDWGTYVMVHVYTSKGIQRAIRAGVKSIEHGQLADEEAVRMMAGEGIWWSLQPFFADEDANVHNALATAKQKKVAQGTAKAYEMAIEHGVKTAWGTDILFSPDRLSNHARHLAKLTRFYEPLELLRMATGNNGELLKMSGPRNPYEGCLGVIAPGALADLLIVDGDPTKGLDFLLDPANNLRVIMKDGVIYKNIL